MVGQDARTSLYWPILRASRTLDEYRWFFASFVLRSKPKFAQQISIRQIFSSKETRNETIVFKQHTLQVSFRAFDESMSQKTPLLLLSTHMAFGVDPDPGTQQSKKAWLSHRATRWRAKMLGSVMFTWLGMSTRLSSVYWWPGIYRSKLHVSWAYFELVWCCCMTIQYSVRLWWGHLLVLPYTSQSLGTRVSVRLALYCTTSNTS